MLVSTRNIFLGSMVTLMFIQGCATTSTSSSGITSLQHAAIQRWNSCMNSSKDIDSPNALRNVSRQLTTACEGHRRDVIETFPRHMENEISLALSNKTRKRLNAMTEAQAVNFGAKEKKPQTNRNAFTSSPFIYH